MGKKSKGAGAAAAAQPPAKPGASMDPRFAALQTDPRFERFPAPRKAVTIDDRFAGMFKDPDFQSGQTVDKRGRKVKRTKQKEDMCKYYRLQGEDAQEQAERDAAPAAVQQPKKQRNKHRQPATAPAPVPAASTEDSEEEAADDQAAADRRWAYLRGVGQPSDSSSSSSEGSSSEEDEEGAKGEEDSRIAAEAEAQWGVGAMAANPAEHIPDGTETRRLAAVDLDWEYVKAVDIYAALRSFLPAGGRIEAVTVYPSDYGLQRMKEETTRGPQGIYKPLANGTAKPGRRRQHRRQADDAGQDSEDDSDAEEDDSEDEEPGSDGSGQLDSEADEDCKDESDSGSGDLEQPGDQELQNSDDEDASTTDEVDQAQLRLYERSKLRYYYAIITFDSVDTASRIYTECDGLEFQLTSCKFDLRFVPDEQSFEGREVRDVATGVPDDYTAPLAAANLALQHTNVKLTWDADDDTRKRALAKRVTKDELRDDDFKAYLASESEESEPDEAAQAKYRALLAGGGGADSRRGAKGWVAGGGDDDDESESEGDHESGARPKSDRDMEMELTFEGGLEALGQRLLSKKQEHEARKKDTVWEAYERRRREKRAAAKAQGRRHDSDSDDISDPEVSNGGAERDDPFFQHTDDPFDDPFFQDDSAAQPAAEGRQRGTKPDKAKRKPEQAAQKAATAAEQKAEERRLAELQLLMMDEGALRRPGAPQAATEAGAGKAAGKTSKKERARLAKARKRRDREAGSDDEDLGLGPATSHKVDLADPRFVQLYTADDFALDPTDPRFKASESVAAIQRRRTEAGTLLQSGAQRSQERRPAQQPSANTAAGDKLPLQAMVASLKRKAGSGVAPKAPSGQAVKPAKTAKTRKRKVQNAA